VYEPQAVAVSFTGVGTINGLAVPVPTGLIHPATVCVTVYAPAVVTVIDAAVEPVDHNKLVPVATRSDDPQLSVTVTVGAAGTGVGLAIPEPVVLVHPATVCVTVYVPPEVTFIDEVVSPVDQDKLLPVAVNVDEPQLSTTVTVGAAGAAGSDNDSFKVFEIQPSS
jgi:hypothetical protein